MFRRLALACIGVLFALVVSGPAAGDEIEKKDLRWIEEIVLRARFALKEDETGTRRWQDVPKLTVAGATAQQRKVIEEVVNQLNEVLKDTPIQKIQILKPNDPTATIKVLLVRKEQIPLTAAKFTQDAEFIQLLRKEKSTGFTLISDTPRRVILEITVGLANDPELAKEFRFQVLDSLLWGLGFSNYSALFEDSFFYRSDRKGPAEVKLTPRDRRLISWFYNHVPPGTTQERIADIYERHWPKK
jgi:hypothetical protein